MTKRKSIEIDGKELHAQPFPAAVRKGNMVFSSAIPGRDPETLKVPDDPHAQISNAFRNMKTAVEAAGGTVDDICKVQVFLPSRELRPVVNEYWVVMFPDEDSRPVRHTVPTDLPNNYVIQIEFVAVVG